MNQDEGDKGATFQRIEYDRRVFEHEPRPSTGSNRYRYSYGGADRDEDDDEDEDEAEEGSSNSSISEFADECQDTEENDRRWGTDMGQSGSTHEDIGAHTPPNTGFGNPAGFAQSIRGSPSSTPTSTCDAAVHATAHPAFQPPSDAVICSDVESPY
ncbi:hypothetical protein R3P38DRAFT_3181590 [Favolaschia claudopus]|uniref:Uncharacterized protein n=1 Tax=Favolaschia claudopus TaxID=2862362 RepID=A0AAW0CLF7_9AGAR